jgi:hypothetical protein
MPIHGLTGADIPTWLEDWLLSRQGGQGSTAVQNGLLPGAVNLFDQIGSRNTEEAWWGDDGDGGDDNDPGPTGGVNGANGPASQAAAVADAAFSPVADVAALFGGLLGSAVKGAARTASLESMKEQLELEDKWGQPIQPNWFESLKEATFNNPFSALTPPEQLLARDIGVFGGLGGGGTGSSPDPEDDNYAVPEFTAEYGGTDDDDTIADPPDLGQDDTVGESDDGDPGGSGGGGGTMGGDDMNAYHHGGYVADGDKGTFRDNVPVTLQEGEYVMPRYAVDKFGIDFLDNLRFEANPHTEFKVSDGELKSLKEQSFRRKQENGTPASPHTIEQGFEKYAREKSKTVPQFRSKK